MRLEGASESQQRAFDSAMAGRNIFLTGEAGSGKSWLINRIICRVCHYRKSMTDTSQERREL